MVHPRTESVFSVRCFLYLLSNRRRTIRLGEQSLTEDDFVTTIIMRTYHYCYVCRLAQLS